MGVAAIILKLVAVAIAYLANKQLLDAGEAEAINGFLSQAQERLERGIKIDKSVASGAVGDDLLHPDGYAPDGRAGPVLPSDK